jgi:Phage capsid family
MPRVTPKSEAPLLTIAPPSPAPEYDPALALLEKNARRAEHQRYLDAKTGDAYYQQRTGDGADAYTAVHSFFRDLLIFSRSQKRAKDTLERALSEGGRGGHDPGSQEPPPGAFAGEDDAAQAEARISSALERDRRAYEELRDLTSASTPDFMRPNGLPSWLAEEYGQANRQVGRIAAAIRNEPLLPGMAQDNGSGTLVLSALPRLSGGAGIAIQASQNSGVQETDPTTSSYVAPVGTIAGQVDLSRQLFDLSRPGADASIAYDLGTATGVLLDSQLVSGSGSSGQLRGLANVSGILTFATSATTAQGQLSAIWDGFNRLAGSTGFGNPDPEGCFLIMHPRRFAWLSGGSGGSGAQVAPNLPGELVLSGGIRTNLGAGTNEDEVLIAEKTNLVLVGGDPAVRVYEEVGSGTLTVRVSSYAFAALVVKNPAAVLRITGFASPTF